jgi:hypothetical protein
LVAGVWFTDDATPVIISVARTFSQGCSAYRLQVCRLGGWISGEDGLTIELLQDTVIKAIFEPWQVSIIPPEISSDTVLTAALSPWHGVSDVTSMPGATLFVEPGAELLMGDMVSIYVHGSLKVIGGTS